MAIYLLKYQNIYNYIYEIKGPFLVRRASVSSIIFPAKGFMPYFIPYKTFSLFRATRDIYSIKIDFNKSQVGRVYWPTVSNLKLQIPKSYLFQTLYYF